MAMMAWPLVAVMAVRTVMCNGGSAGSDNVGQCSQWGNDTVAAMAEMAVAVVIAVTTVRCDGSDDSDVRWQ
jgi:hypothetical protein